MTQLRLIPVEEVSSASIWIPIVKAYRYETVPTSEQEAKLAETLEICRNLNNILLGHRKDAYKNGGLSIKYDDQQDQLPELRAKHKELKLEDTYEQVEQNVADRVDGSYKRYFERIKNNKKDPKKYKKPGHPRFKSKNSMKSFTFPQYGNGCRIMDSCGKYTDKGWQKTSKGDIIRLSKIGDIKFIKHIEIGDGSIPFRIKTATVKKEVDKWIFIPTIETFVEIEIPIDVYKKLEKSNIKSLMNLIYDLEDSRSKNKIYEKIKKELKVILLEISKYH